MITRDIATANTHFWDIDGNNPPPNGYDQEGSNVGANGSQYRTDCSGFVSMCLELAYSPNTSELRSTFVVPISANQLIAGDLILAVADSNHTFGHVAMFLGWTGDDHTSYNAAEFGGGDAPIHHVIPYPYFSWDSHDYNPYRPNVFNTPIPDPPTPTPIPEDDVSQADVISALQSAAGQAAIAKAVNGASGPLSVVFFQQVGSPNIYHADLQSGTFFHVLNMDDLRDSQHVLTAEGVNWATWPNPVANLEAFGQLTTATH